jgi:hypothetical protein
MIVIFFTAFYIIPYLAYVFYAFDRHYYGYFNEREPRLALTTAQKKFYEEHNIPYKTVQDVEKERKKDQYLEAQGLPSLFHPKYQEA